jgi:hypothetical protein
MNKKTFGLLFAGCATILAASSAQARLIKFGTIQDHQQGTCAAAATKCFAEFAAAASLASTKATYIETISCWIRITRNANKQVINRIQLNQTSSSGVHVFIAPLSVMETTATDIKYQVYASGLNYLVTAGSKPQVIADLSAAQPGAGEIVCAYTGKQDQ